VDRVTVIDRRAGRVLLVDRDGRALLLHGGDPARPGERWWLTPGGGLHGDETPAEAAARELFEEIGLQVEPAALGVPVWHDAVEFGFDGRAYRQEQDFFCLRVDDWQADLTGLTADERRIITASRWWSAEEIEASAEQIYPVSLPSLIRQCLAAVR
jgi:8-oxo-dGTP pyrophosphatase MutT (NUDIX family)